MMNKIGDKNGDFHGEQMDDWLVFYAEHSYGDCLGEYGE